MLHEIAQVRVTELGRKLEVFDTMGNLRIDFKPFSGEKHIDEAADFLKTLMPRGLFIGFGDTRWKTQGTACSMRQLGCENKPS